MRVDLIRIVVWVYLACALGQDAAGQEASSDHRQYLTGRAFRETLESQVSVTYRNVPLRRALYRLTHERGLALVLDRRIDPSVLVDRRSFGQSRRELLEGLAGVHGGELAVVGDVLYIAPPTAARRMAALIDRGGRELAALPAARRRALRRRWTLRWKDLTAAEEIVEQVGAHYEFELQRLDRIPWDLWAATTLPETTAVEQLSFVLAQFDLTFRWENRGAAARIVPIPPDEREPAVSSRQSGADRSTRQRPRRKGGQAVFTASPKNVPLDAVLRELADKAGFDLSVDWQALGQAGIGEDRLISFTAKRNTLDEVLHKVLDPLDVTFERVGQHIYVPARREGPEAGATPNPHQ